MEPQVLQDIREELRELRILYGELVGRLIEEDTPTAEEKRAIETDEEYADEEELRRVQAKIPNANTP
jgi:hypothetical protein